ncbi:hypothetical protein [Pararhizobium sp.]|uniref:hypothetical protein n=1 Tax=Pararhizobium sp. TaxID=1977563 RepID=UPI003D0C2CFE
MNASSIPESGTARTIIGVFDGATDAKKLPAAETDTASLKAADLFHTLHIALASGARV